MLKLNAITKLNDILNQFLAGMGIECVADIDADFNYCYSTSTAYYALAVPAEGDMWFKEFCKSIAPEIEADTFLLSWLHEVGHNESIDEIDDADYAYGADVKATLGTSREDYFTYFNLPVEIAATTWALDFIRRHPAEIAELWANIQPIIMEIFIENDVDVEA